MSAQLLICSDLDRTLIPNGPQPESAYARDHFSTLASHPEVALAYVSGRDLGLVEQAINEYRLPVPDFVVADVGTSIYQQQHGSWQLLATWQQQIADDWQGLSRAQLAALLQDIRQLSLQEESKQGHHKLSYYTPVQLDTELVGEQIQQRLRQARVQANLIWSIDEPRELGLLDILPASASKYHAIEMLIAESGFNHSNTVFCGDSGNDLEVLASAIPSVLVANSNEAVQQQATALAARCHFSAQLYIARGGFMGMNGNYSAGMLEGIAHFHPQSLAWMGFPAEGVHHG